MLGLRGSRAPEREAVEDDREDPHDQQARADAHGGVHPEHAQDPRRPGRQRAARIGVLPGEEREDGGGDQAEHDADQQEPAVAGRGVHDDALELLIDDVLVVATLAGRIAARGCHVAIVPPLGPVGSVSSHGCAGGRRATAGPPPRRAAR